MSHFTVMVKVTAKRLGKKSLKEAVDEMLAPYQENNMGNCPKQYMQFNDTEEKSRKEWENDKVKRIRMPDGELVSPWDERFRMEGSFGLGSATHKPPDHLECVQVPLKELYPDFDDFMTDYQGCEKDPKLGRYGYWENPNAKWDWYVIGGRWSGLFRLKEMVTAVRGERGAFNQDEPNVPHAGDGAKIEDIDFEGMDLMVDERIEEFWKDYQRWLELRAGSPKREYESFLDFDVHCQLYNLGLVTVDETKSCDDDSRFTYKPVTLEELKTAYRHNWEFSTYAVLDDEGWHAKGEMGWFGCSSDTPAEKADFEKSFKARFIDGEKPDTTLVIVDCHI